MLKSTTRFPQRLLSRAVMVASFSGLATSTLAIAELTAQQSVESLLEEVVVVGSRGAPRSVEDSVVPVDVLSAADLTHSATIAGEVGSLLSANIPSFNMPRQSNSDQADIVRVAQLRGLSPDQVLVLVNGKRRHANAVVSVESKLGKGAAAVDFNNIPTSAIERIEVLRDGAAAQYGSDAIAGVINIVLKKGAEGGSIAASYGAHVTEIPANGDQSITDGQTGIFSFNKGFALENGFINISGEYRERAATNRAGFDELPTIGFAEWIVPVPASGTPEAAANDAMAGQRNYRVGDGESKDLNLAYNAAINLESGYELYSFGTYSDRSAEGSNFYRYPVSANNVTEIYPNGFVPVSDATISDMALALGAKGTLGDWNIDSSVSYGENTYDDDIKNSINASLGSDSPTSFNRAEYEYSQSMVNVDVQRAITLQDMPVNLAAGLELRHETYQTRAGDEASYIAGTDTTANIGSQGGPGLRPEETVDESRDSYSLYIDAEFQVTSDVLISTALRYEDYDDFGDTVNSKLAGRWQLTDNLALRGAISTGFRAPSLAQTYFSGSSTGFGDGGGLVSALNLSVSDPLAIAYGAEELDAEQSTNRSLGLVWSTDNASFTIDFYEIDIDDRIALSETIDITGTQGVEAIRFFTNVVDTETRGMDIIASYDIAAWTLRAAYNKTDTNIVNNPDRAIFGIEETNTFETAAPKDKIILTTTWTSEQVSVMLRATRFGETQRVFDFGDGYEPTQTYSAKWSVDTDVTVRVADGWNVSVGANNLLDEYPDESIYDISYFANLPYDGVISPLGVNGRYVYMGTNYSF